MLGGVPPQLLIPETCTAILAGLSLLACPSDLALQGSDGLGLSIVLT